ncbi:hypothetical protein Patl1_19315 [Pistacia atlantica]|uniref:Uncharacterized protein n=1 Tax=Pistacia atlantica TaxID=434234 RepID=A0ACC1BY74_9ROSI|nr:hypothetical protein Patl1_19315 [Pistacia atlantica]
MVSLFNDYHSALKFDCYNQFNPIVTAGLAQQKMHCAVQRTHIDNQKVIDGGKCYSIRKSLEHDNYRASAEDCEIVSPNVRKSDKRTSSHIIPQRSGSLKSSDIFCENSKVDKAIKRNLRKKARKKGKQKKKLSRDSVSTEPEVFSEDYDCGTLVAKTCGKNDMDHGDRLVSCATSQEDSLSDSRVNVIDLENNNGTRNSSESPKTCTSYIDEIDLSEVKVPSSVQNFHGGYHVIDSEIRIQMDDQGFSILDGGIEETNHLQTSCYGGIHSNGLPDMHESRVLDSVSVGSNSDISTITSCEAKPCDKGSNENGLSDPPDYGSRKGSSDMQVVAPGKKSKQAKTVLRGSSAYKVGSAGNSHGHTGKENSHRVWQKVQKNNTSECNSDFQKVHPVGSQTLKEASFVRRNPNAAEDSLLASSCRSLDKMNMFEVRSPVYLPHLIVNEAAQKEKDISLAEYSKQNHCSGSFLQKWIPIGTKNPQSTTSTRCNSVSSRHSDGQGVEDWMLRSNVDEKVEEENYTPKLKNTSAHTFKEKNSKHIAANCLTIESKDQNFSAVETDLDKILLAVNHASRMQLASEAVQMATGSPIAEFERLLHFSSPVICHSPNIISCNECSQDQGVGASLCRHEIPNISLGCLWQWYEKHGSLWQFSCSRSGKSHSTNRRNGLPTPGNLEADEIGETSQSSSYIGHLPTYSLLVPQPRTSDTSAMPHEKEFLDPLSFSEFKSWLAVMGPSQWKAYGDPTYLNSINLHDLHPTSWYSVAWYPIYRIPDGNFRAAFLTYHSLGHMIRRSTKVNSANVDSIVSPVVGLQSYNAQSECWFQLKHPAMNQTAESSGLNPSRILRERLKTLEETASHMSTAVVNKGNQTSVNRHPDYEFFRSRQRS